MRSSFFSILSAQCQFRVLRIFLGARGPNIGAARLEPARRAAGRISHDLGLRRLAIPWRHFILGAFRFRHRLGNVRSQALRLARSSFTNSFGDSSCGGKPVIAPRSFNLATTWPYRISGCAVIIRRRSRGTSPQARPRLQPAGYHKLGQKTQNFGLR